MARQKWEGVSYKSATRLKWTKEEMELAEDVAKQFGLTLVELLAIVHRETGGCMRPNVVNSIGATGLIQFVPTTAKELLKMDSKESAQLRLTFMSVSEQLELMRTFLTARTRGHKGLDAVYSSIFVGNPITSEFKKGTKAYEANQSLDANRDGTITRTEWMIHVRELASRIKVSDYVVA
jgi:hypothetical protein